MFRKNECVSYCKACASVQEDNSRASAGELSHVHAHNHAVTYLLHQHSFAFWALLDVDAKHWNIY